jgi:hypothetical protein
MTAAGLPNMMPAVNAWAQTLQFVVVGRESVDFKTVETYSPIKGRGMRVPMTAQQLQIKPEGQRAWKWERIFCSPSIQLEVNDIIIFGLNSKETRYRVMAKTDYSEYGYLEYEIVQDFTEC